MNASTPTNSPTDANNQKTVRPTQRETPRFNPLARRAPRSTPRAPKLRRVLQSRFVNSRGNLPLPRLLFGDVDFLEMFEENAPTREGSLNQLADMFANSGISEPSPSPTTSEPAEPVKEAKELKEPAEPAQKPNA